MQLVEVALQDKISRKSNDIYWVVFDRESTSKYTDQLHQTARQLANANQINIAISNVCFEYWFLLHFRYTNAAYTSCNDLLRNSQLKADLQTVGISDYDKGFALIFEKIKDKIPDAKRNSTRLLNTVIQSAPPGIINPHQLNPYIDIQKLFEAMEEFCNS